MDIKPIKTENDYQNALNKLEVLFDAPIGTVESDEADILGLLIDEYEKINYPIEAPDPIEAIKKSAPTIPSFHNCSNFLLRYCFNSFFTSL